MSNGLQVYSPYHLRTKKSLFQKFFWLFISSIFCFLFGLGIGYMGYLDTVLLPLSKHLDIETFKMNSLSFSEQQDQQGLLMQVKQLEKENATLHRNNLNFEQQVTDLSTIPEEKGEAQLSAKIRLLQAENIDLTQGKVATEKQLHMLQSTHEVNQIALKGAQKSLLQMEENLAGLKGELSIYQRLSSDSNQKNILNIQNFTLIKKSSILKFQLVLSKGGNKSAVIKGDAYISAQGKMNGQQRILNLAEISPGLSNSLHFQFRFFQVLNGTLQWPEGFKPETLFVRVIPTTKGSQEISQRWAWTELLAKVDQQ